MGSKKPGAHRVELLGQLDRLCCGLRCGFRNRLVLRLCSRCGALVPAIAAIKVRTLMPLGWMTGVMNRRGWIVENLFAYRVVL